jgi:hypothetical protein
MRTALGWFELPPSYYGAWSAAEARSTIAQNPTLACQLTVLHLFFFACAWLLYADRWRLAPGSASALPPLHNCPCLTLHVERICEPVFGAAGSSWRR